MLEGLMLFFIGFINLFLLLPWVMILGVPIILVGIQLATIGWFIMWFAQGLYVSVKSQKWAFQPWEGKPMQVLLVDDNPSTLIVLQRVLKAKKCILKVVQSGVEAIEELQKSAYDLVVLDNSMPELSGPETLQKADRVFSQSLLKRFKSLPVIEYSSDKGQDWSLLAMSHFRVIDSVSKRMPPSQLKNKMDQLFSQINVA